MQNTTKKKILRVFLNSFIVAAVGYLAYALGSIVVSSFWGISDDNPMLSVVSVLGSAGICGLFFYRLFRNIRHETDNPYGEAVGWAADRGSRLVVVLLVVFVIGTAIRDSIETDSRNYSWILAALALAILTPKRERRRHFEEWKKLLKFLYSFFCGKMLLRAEENNGGSSTENTND